MSIAILVPVLGRPERVQPLVDSALAAATATPCQVLFIVSPDDHDERHAILEAIDRVGSHELVDGLDVEWNRGPGDYARKMNAGAQFAAKKHEWLFLGADDLHFHPGWAERALAVYAETGACVIGTNDLGNQNTVTGQHSTHTLVHRDYLECGTFDEPDSGKLLHEGYDHQYVDNEFVETADRRGTYVHADDVIVEHLHPLWRKGEQDATYTLGQAKGAEDRALFAARRRLWL